MYTKIKASRIQAMKDKNEIAKAFLSTFMGEIEKEAKNAMTEPTNAMVEQIAKKMAKNIQDNIKLYADKGLSTAKEEAELVIITEYLPQVLSEEQTREAVITAITQSGVTDAKDQGKVMGALKKEFGNKLDMKLVSQIVRETLNS